MLCTLCRCCGRQVTAYISRTNRTITLRYQRGPHDISVPIPRTERSRFVGGPIRFVMFSYTMFSNFRLFYVCGTLSFVDGACAAAVSNRQWPCLSIAVIPRPEP